jgi:hypothetical protein
MSRPPTNDVFQQALQKHLDVWKSDSRSFSIGSTPDDIMQEIEKYEREHQKSRGRRYADRFSTVVKGFQSYFAAVDTLVSTDPHHVAALIWGGLKFVVQVCYPASIFAPLTKTCRWNRLRTTIPLISNKLLIYSRRSTATFPSITITLPSCTRTQLLCWR